MKITKSIKYVGVNDHEIDLFEGQYHVPFGMSYNSYVIIDEKIAVMDSVDLRFAGEWIEKVRASLDGRLPDYLIIQHMEPDHSSSIMEFVNSFPDVTIVSSAKSFNMMCGFFGRDFADQRIVVAEGDNLSLGKHQLRFIAAPMVHWPEVIVSYESTEKILFSADAFGKFGALDHCDEWEGEARRYYFGIVSKYGSQVQTLLKKTASLDIEKICPLHGPVLEKNTGHYVGLYNLWSSYEPENHGVCIAYTSVYGNTRAAAELLYKALCEKGVDTRLYDLSRCDMHKAVVDAFRYDKLVLATTTYNGDIFPFMREFISHLTEREFQKRRVAFIENCSWAPRATKIMKAMLEKSKNLSYASVEIRIISAVNEKNREEIKALAEEFSK